MVEFVPRGIESGVAQSEVGGDIDHLAPLFEQLRHQLHGFAAWQRHDDHVGVPPDTTRVHGHHFLVHKVSQVRVQAGHGPALLRLGCNVREFHVRVTGQQPDRLGAAVP